MDNVPAHKRHCRAEDHIIRRVRGGTAVPSLQQAVHQHTTQHHPVRPGKKMAAQCMLSKWMNSMAGNSSRIGRMLQILHANNTGGFYTVGQMSLQTAKFSTNTQTAFTLRNTIITHSPSPTSDVGITMLTVGMVTIHLSQKQGLGWVVAGQQLPQARNAGREGGGEEGGRWHFSCQALFTTTQLKCHAPHCLLTSAVCRHRQPPATAAPSALGVGGSQPRWPPAWRSVPTPCWPPRW